MHKIVLAAAIAAVTSTQALAFDMTRQAKCRIEEDGRPPGIGRCHIASTMSQGAYWAKVTVLGRNYIIDGDENDLQHGWTLNGVPAAVLEPDGDAAYRCYRSDRVQLCIVR